MFTTCPACRMNLAVTATDLRIGQGYVRCGRCDRVFNALLSLSEDLDEDQQSGLVATGTATMPTMEDSAPPAPLPAETATQPEPDAASRSDESNWAVITPIRAPAPHEVEVIENQPTGTFETIVLEGDGYLQTEEHVDERDVDEQLRIMAAQMETRHAPTAMDEHIVMETGAEPRVLEIDADAAVGNPRRHHWAWSATAAALTLALLMQLIHHSRHMLVANPWFERPMQSLYAAFGSNLEASWDLKAYDLRQLGGEALAGTTDRIVLRASVHNRATNSQPPPMIRVILQDRFGNALSTTAITPTDYLRSAAPARMASDQRLDATLTVADPARQAVGFELDACLPDAAGKLHCSNDQ